MTNAHILNAILVQPSKLKDEWPSFFISLDSIWFEYTGSGLERLPSQPMGDEVLPEAKGKKYNGAYFDGESMVLSLENGSAVVFELAPDPENMRSWPAVRLASKEDFDKWKDELEKMDKIR